MVHATALEFEADLTYGALNLELRPLLDSLSAIAEVHQHAIAIVGGIEPEAAPTQVPIGAATLALISSRPPARSNEGGLDRRKSGGADRPKQCDR